MMIINADDYGLDVKTNDAILESFHNGFISSTTLMANMSGFMDACDKARSNRLEKSIGIHLNLTAGQPLSIPIQSNRKFCQSSGDFVHDRKSLIYLGKEDQSDIYNEYSAQIQKLISSGIVPTHIDSHHHYHVEPALLLIVCKLAKQYNIPFVRLTRNCGDGIGSVKSIFKAMTNNYIKNKGLSPLDYFGSVEDIIKLNKLPPYKFEVMVHPVYTDKGILIDATNKAKMRDNFDKLRTIYSDVLLQNYGDLNAITYE